MGTDWPKERAGFLRAMRSGDAAGWIAWNPRFLAFEELLAAWSEALAERRAGRAAGPLHVYVNTPYCPTRCRFCRYWACTPGDPGALDRLLAHQRALFRRYREALGLIEADHAYFGGGTPSIFGREALDGYLAAFRETVRVRGELTFEAIPATLDEAKLAVLAAHGVNRLSVGVQSLEPAVLTAIRRPAVAPGHIAAIVDAGRAAGMVVNVDLVLGLPGESRGSFQAGLAQVLQMGPDMVTSYRYTPHPGLPEPAALSYAEVFDEATREQIGQLGYDVELPPGDEGLRANLHRRRGDEPFGVEHYSNFDQPHADLLGLGPGAYSHIFGWAWLRDVSPLDRGVAEGQPTYWGTRLSPEDELRAAVLCDAAEGRWSEPEVLRARTGLDVLALLDGPLAAADRAGVLLRDEAGRFRLAPSAGTAGARFVDALVPGAQEPPAMDPEAAAAMAAELGPLVPPELEEGLHVLRWRAWAQSERPARAAFRAWCRLLGVPAPGHRLGPAVVEQCGQGALTVRLTPAPAPALTVLVRPRDERPCFGHSRRFAIAFAARKDAPLTPQEEDFLQRLLARTQAADP